MFPFAELVVSLGYWARLAAPPAAIAPTAPLRTFLVDKQADEKPGAIDRRPNPAALPMPDAHGRLRTSIGVGYVEGASWGLEARTSGSVAGLDLNIDGLLTHGAQGIVLDRASVMVRNPERRWFAEAGDLFSELRGPARGARVSWQATDKWRTGLAFYGPSRVTPAARHVFAIRNRVDVGPATLDGEVATDGSFFARGRTTWRDRLDLEASVRRGLRANSPQDAGIQGQVHIWKGIALSAGIVRSEYSGQTSVWRTVGVRVPLHRSIGVTIERTFTTTNDATGSAWAVMADVHTSQLTLLQRIEFGRTRPLQPGLLDTDRESAQSMASYTFNPQLNLGLRVATEWRPSGPPTSWLEAHATIKLARRTLVQITAPVPRPLDVDRVQVRVEQGLPRQFSLVAEYGRPSAYQDVPIFVEPPRFKLMLHRAFDVRTGARGGSVRGTVVDYVGRPVAGARVRLGQYATESDADGRYAFTHVPKGEFELSLDPDFLPADYAWDGRSRRFALKDSSRLIQDLVVAPLNAIHGRVFADRNTNGRYDEGEGVAGAVVSLGDRLTSCDSEGRYDFFNLAPGAHVIRLDATRLPSAFQPSATTALHVTLGDNRPVVGADFMVTDRVKTIIWKTIR